MNIRLREREGVKISKIFEPLCLGHSIYIDNDEQLKKRFMDIRRKKKWVHCAYITFAVSMKYSNGETGHEQLLN